MHSKLKTTKTTEVLFYILRKIKQADRYKLIKLVYLADKYHLLHYGRTVTKDPNYYAMPNGPVSSIAKDVLSFNGKMLTEEQIEYVKSLIKTKDSDYNYEAIDKNIDFDNLSETDIESLNFIIKLFGEKTEKELIEYTHQYPEWYKNKESFKKSFNKRVFIEQDELCSILDVDPLLEGISPSHVTISKELIKGTYE